MKIKDYFVREWMFLVLMAVPFIAAATLWDKIPDNIAISWDMSGQAATLAPKAAALLLVPSLNVLIYFLFAAVPLIDRRWKRYNLFKTSYSIVRIAVHAIFVALFFFSTLPSIGSPMENGFALKYSIVLLMLVFGYSLRFVGINHFVGYRLPWTYKSQETWKKTHEMASSLWVILSLLILVAGFFVSVAAFNIIFFSSLCILLIVPTVYSYALSRRAGSNG